MHLDYFTFRQHDFVCPACGWKGKGRELTESESDEAHKTMDLDCPSCAHYMGYWHTPPREVIRDWQNLHPDWKEGD